MKIFPNIGNQSQIQGTAWSQIEGLHRKTASAIASATEQLLSNGSLYIDLNVTDADHKNRVMKNENSVT